jgi:hypothetical protein
MSEQATSTSREQIMGNEMRHGAKPGIRQQCLANHDSVRARLIQILPHVTSIGNFQWADVTITHNLDGVRQLIPEDSDM